MKKSLVFLIVFVIGCVNFTNSGPVVSSGLGVTIESFEVDFADLENGDSTELNIEIQNNGGTTTGDVWALIYGIDTSEWDLSAGTKNPVKVADSLEGPDEEAGLPGDSAFAKWDLEAPDVPEGITTTYQPRVRVFYTYSTSSSASIPIITEEEFKRLKGGNEVLPQLGSTFVSKGPLNVNIDARSPEVLRDEDDTFRVVVTVTNVGGGSVFDPDAINDIDEGSESSTLLSEEDLDEFIFRIEAQGVEEVDCDALNDDTVQTLRKGQSATYNCELKIGKSLPRVDLPVTVLLNYGYFIDRLTLVEVTGK